MTAHDDAVARLLARPRRRSPVSSDDLADRLLGALDELAALVAVSEEAEFRTACAERVWACARRVHVDGTIDWMRCRPAVGEALLLMLDDPRVGMQAATAAAKRFVVGVAHMPPPDVPSARYERRRRRQRSLTRKGRHDVPTT